MNEFRDRILAGTPLNEPLLRSKTRKGAADAPTDLESLAGLAIAREAARSANHRDADRHRLEQESVVLLHQGREQFVTLVNLSGGGAMIEGGDGLKLQDRVEVRLGEISTLEAIVRWIRGQRIGLEFAHETRVDMDPAALSEMLTSVIRRSFPDVILAIDAAATDASPVTRQEPVESFSSTFGEQMERELRHPLIWSGLIHFNHDSTPVRLRNISSGGALIESATAFPVGAELLLDLGAGGTIFANVHWARGDQAGLSFRSPFDLSLLAKVRPEVAGARWIAPDYLLDDQSDSSPWSPQWGRSDLGSLHRRLTRRP